MLEPVRQGYDYSLNANDPFEDTETGFIGPIFLLFCRSLNANDPFEDTETRVDKCCIKHFALRLNANDPFEDTETYPAQAPLGQSPRVSMPTIRSRILKHAPDLLIE